MRPADQKPTDQSAIQATSPIGLEPALVSYTLSPGTLVGRYQIVEKLATGGMGVVFRAYDPELSRHVALKLVQQSSMDFDRLASAEEYEQRLLREAQALARLSHPNVVAAFDVGKVEGALFIAMELIDGVSLRRWLQVEPRSRADILHILLEAGRGLSAAHRAGVVHRDFKLSNVMVSAQGRAQVVDFGLARTIGVARDHSPDGPIDLARELEGSMPVLNDASGELTRTGTIVGTAGYIAPEQFEGVTSDERSDQFSYASSAFCALTGRVPYQGDTLADYRAALLRGERAPWPNSIPRSIRSVIDRGLSLRPEERYPALDALLDDLERCARPVRRAPIVVGAALGLSLVASILAARERFSDPCPLDAQSFDRAWSGERRGHVERAFEASGNPRAADSFSAIAARLDDYRLRWQTAKQEACLAAHVRHEQSEQVLSLRNACLDSKLAQLDTVIGLFHQADAALVDRAPDALDALAQLRDCSDIAALVGESERLPDDPVRRSQIEALQARWDTVQAVFATGRWNEGLELAQNLSVDAETVGYKPIQARAMSHSLMALERLGRQEEAKALRPVTLAFASEAKVSDVVATLAVRLLLLAIDGDRLAEAKAMLPLVDASLGMAGRPPALQIRLLTYQAAVLTADGNFQAAIDQLELALATCRQLGQEGLRSCLTPQRELGLVYWARRDAAGTRRELEAAVDVARQAYGPRHPNLLNEYNNLGYFMARLGILDVASRALAESKSIAATLPKNRQSANIPQVEGLILQKSGDPLAALPFLETAARELAAAYGEESAHVAETWYIWGTCLMDLGRPKDAATRFERALESRRKMGARSGTIAEVAFALAEALWTLPPERRQARELAEQALALYREEGAVSAANAQRVAEWLAAHPPAVR
jgi:tRNA A-37 threonylcarbamoyl transferase component Bud32/tetratricopeptide (TPR) repeat protein